MFFAGPIKKMTVVKWLPTSETMLQGENADDDHSVRSPLSASGIFH